MKATFANLEHLCDQPVLLGLSIWPSGEVLGPLKHAKMKTFFFSFPNHENWLGSILKGMPPWEQSHGKTLFHSAPCCIYFIYINTCLVAHPLVSIIHVDQFF